jgi:hypothetical protein
MVITAKEETVFLLKSRYLHKGKEQNYENAVTIAKIPAGIQTKCLRVPSWPARLQSA